MKRHKQFSSINNVVDPAKPYITNKRKITKIAVHCTATIFGQHCDAKRVDQMHLNRWGRRSGCGYHYVIDIDGVVYKGRWSDHKGAHVKNFNANSIGIAYAGGLNKNREAMTDGMNEAQKRSMKALLKSLLKGYDLKPKDVLGHKEFPGANKACPCTPMQDLRDML